jgi:hypothetical protein
MTDSIWGTGLSHRYALLAAYLLALVCWNRIARRYDGVWPNRERISFARPHVELAWFGAALVVAGVASR